MDLLNQASACEILSASIIPLNFPLPQFPSPVYIQYLKIFFYMLIILHALKEFSCTKKANAQEEKYGKIICSWEKMVEAKRTHQK